MGGDAVVVSRRDRHALPVSGVQQIVRIRLAARVTEWVLVVTGQDRRASVNITNPRPWEYRAGTCYKIRRGHYPRGVQPFPAAAANRGAVTIAGS